MRSLDAAWQAHLVPRQPDAPTVVSLFAGCGGSSLGYSMAGYRELLAVEWDDNAVATFRLNFPDVPVYHGDIAALSVADVLAQTGLQPGALDVLDGSPPCQGFSTAGKRQLDDPRNGLFREYVRLLEGLQPKAFVLENVSGMVKGKMRLVFAEALQALKAADYRVSARVLNAMYFGVPQSRERLIVVGVRSDLEHTPTHPSALGRPITLRAACGDIQSLVLGPHGTYPGRVVDAAREPSPTLCRTGLPSFQHGVYVDGQRAPTPSLLKSRRWQATPQGAHHPVRFSLARLAWDATPGALQKTATGSTGTMHPDEPRELHAWELKRIGSFPDAFVITGTWTNVLNRIGNSVPPLFMRAIAQHVRQTIFSEAL